MIDVHPITAADREWVGDLLVREWGSARVVSRGRLHDAAALPGFIARVDGERAGLVTYRIEGEQCELVTLNSTLEGRGVGSGLIEAVIAAAREARCARLWLITTNDNLAALRFYQKRGLRLVAVHRDALDESRRLKPEIPLTGEQGIPLRDEIELEMRL